MKFGVVVFPGSNCDQDCVHVVQSMGHEAVLLWHKQDDLQGCDALILPGGFSYGDYLRCGAMAAHAHIMPAVKQFADRGGLVLGICNGFQILQAAGMLPGALMRNESLHFICRDVHVRVENNATPFTRSCRVGEVLKLPIAHMEGNFYLDRKALARLDERGQVLLRYCDDSGSVSSDSNPNGAMDAVAGITNEAGNVCGMMPHPERCAEALLGNKDGIKIFQSLIASMA